MSIINAGIQLVPLKHAGDKYALIDKAIALIRDSGLKCIVCPFETVVEGESDVVYALIANLQRHFFAEGGEECLINIRIHAAKRDLFFEDNIRGHSER